MLVIPLQAVGAVVVVHLANQRLCFIACKLVRMSVHCTGERTRRRFVAMHPQN